MADPILDMFHGVESKPKDLTEAPELDYPGKTPPRNRPGGETYEEAKCLLSDLPSYEFIVDGDAKTFYPIRALKIIFNREPVTIRSWEDKGILPKPKFRTQAPRGGLPGKTNKGRRLYSVDQIRFLITVSERHNMTDQQHADWAGFKKSMLDYPTT